MTCGILELMHALWVPEDNWSQWCPLEDCVSSGWILREKRMIMCSKIWVLYYSLHNVHFWGCRVNADEIGQKEGTHRKALSLF